MRAKRWYIIIMFTIEISNILTIGILILLFFYLYLRRQERKNQMDTISKALFKLDFGMPLILTIYFIFIMLMGLLSGFAYSEAQRISNRNLVAFLCLGWVLLFARKQFTSFVSQKLALIFERDYKKLSHIIYLFYILTVLIIILLGFAYL